MSDDRWSGYFLESASTPTDSALQLRQFAQFDIGLQDFHILEQIYTNL